MFFLERGLNLDKKYTHGSSNADKPATTKTLLSLAKKIETLLEKRKIEGSTVTAAKDKVELKLPLDLEDAKLEKLMTAIKEVPGSDKVVIINAKGPAAIVSDDIIDADFADRLSKYLPKEVQVSGSAKDGVLTLHGTATSAFARQAVVDLAKDTGGVKKIIDIMKVPQVGSDVDISNSVMLELGHEPAISVYHLQVATRNGIVYMTGNAKDEKSVKLAAKAVSKVPGVRQVENGIRLQGAGLNADDKLRDQIIDTLVKSSDVRARDIKVTVVNSAVFLRGYAATTKEIIAAEAIVSSMMGVKKVFMELEPRL